MMEEDVAEIKHDASIGEHTISFDELVRSI